MNSRANWVLAGAVAVLVLIAAVAVLVARSQADPELPQGSPEAVVQGYLAALYADDPETALSYLEADSDCDVRDLEDAYVPDEGRVVLESTSQDGDRASVRVQVIHSEDAPLDTGWAEEKTFELRREATWVIIGAPWPLYSCTPGGGGR